MRRERARKRDQDKIRDEVEKRFTSFSLILITLDDLKVYDI